MNIEQAIRQERFSDAIEKAVVNIIYTSNWLRDVQNTILKQHDLLVQHYNALRIIKGRYPAAISPGEIKEVMLDKANDLTRLLDKLTEKGLVKRTVCEENRRKVDIVMTPKGVKFLEKLQSELSGLKIDVKQRITDKEAIQLSNLLDKLRN